MFQRQAFGSLNPFQTPFQAWGGGVNPFAQYAGAVSPFHQFTGGINPLQQQVPWQIPGQISPFQQLVGGVTPLHLLGGGINPLFGQVPGVAQQPGFIPGIGVPPGGAGLGLHPLAAQFGYGAGPVGAGISPLFGQITGIAQQPGFIPGIGVTPAGAGLGVHPLAAQFGYGGGTVNPYLAHVGALAGIDPTTALMLAQQQLPIRPLVGQNPLDQIQSLAANPTFGQPIDPYTALIHAQMASQLPTNSLQQLIRGQVGVPYPWGAGQTSPFTNPMIPFGI